MKMVLLLAYYFSTPSLHRISEKRRRHIRCLDKLESETEEFELRHYNLQNEEDCEKIMDEFYYSGDSLL